MIGVDKILFTLQKYIYNMYIIYSIVYNDSRRYDTIYFVMGKQTKQDMVYNV